MRHERSKEHRRRLEIGPISGWWEQVPATAEDWCGPERNGWGVAWGVGNDEWRDESAWIDGVGERVRRWLGDIETLKEEEREREWISGMPPIGGESNGEESDDVLGKTMKGRGNKNDEALYQEFLLEPPRGVPEALGWVRPSALRDWMEQIAERQGYSSEQKQRADTFLQLPTEEKIHQIHTLVKKLRPFVFANE
jgi:hypothetical protein